MNHSSRPVRLRRRHRHGECILRTEPQVYEKPAAENRPVPDGRSSVINLRFASDYEAQFGQVHSQPSHEQSASSQQSQSDSHFPQAQPSVAILLTIDANSDATVASSVCPPSAGHEPPLQHDWTTSLVITNVASSDPQDEPAEQDDIDEQEFIDASDADDWQDAMSHPVASQAPSLQAVMSNPHGHAADAETNFAPGFNGSLLLVANEIEAMTAKAA